MCQVKVLSSKSNITASYCPDCGQWFLWYHNLLLNFNKEKFKGFRDAIAALKYEDCSFPFPDQIDRAVISTPCHDISLVFSWGEWKSLIEVMDEAMYMKEVHNILSN